MVQEDFSIITLHKLYDLGENLIIPIKPGRNQEKKNLYEVYFLTWIVLYLWLFRSLLCLQLVWHRWLIRESRRRKKQNMNSLQQTSRRRARAWRPKITWWPTSQSQCPMSVIPPPVRLEMRLAVRDWKPAFSTNQNVRMWGRIHNVRLLSAATREWLCSDVKILRECLLPILNLMTAQIRTVKSPADLKC